MSSLFPQSGRLSPALLVIYATFCHALSVRIDTTHAHNCYKTKCWG
ncbi:hypothetical protein ATN83_p10102 (plasmid) [Raoultella ornithinolytica]|nr:hypothetical protein ATN83_p10102 [Raoultella ornithinolytica]